MTEVNATDEVDFPVAGSEVESLLGGDHGSPWSEVDWDADPDWEWASAADDSPEELMALWTGAVARSRTAAA